MTLPEKNRSRQHITRARHNGTTQSHDTKARHKGTVHKGTTQVHDAKSRYKGTTQGDDTKSRRNDMTQRHGTRAQHKGKVHGHDAKERRLDTPTTLPNPPTHHQTNPTHTIQTTCTTIANRPATAGFACCQQRLGGCPFRASASGRNHTYGAPRAGPNDLHNNRKSAHYGRPWPLCGDCLEADCPRTHG